MKTRRAKPQASVTPFVLFRCPPQSGTHLWTKYSGGGWGGVGWVLLLLQPRVKGNRGGWSLERFACLVEQNQQNLEVWTGSFQNWGVS